MLHTQRLSVDIFTDGVPIKTRRSKGDQPVVIHLNQGMVSSYTLGVLLLTGVPPALGQQKCRQTGLVPIDFSSITNPAVAMEWTDGTQAPQQGATIPAGWSGLNNTGGELRWKRIGSVETEEGVVQFDLRVTVAPEPTYYSDSIEIEYSSTTTIPPASFSEAGYACLGFGLQPSFCPSGAALDSVANCADGTPIRMKATEFDFHFVQTGTTTPMPALGLTYISFFDVDGDTTGLNQAGTAPGGPSVQGAAGKGIELG